MFNLIKAPVKQTVNKFSELPIPVIMIPIVDFAIVPPSFILLLWGSPRSIFFAIQYNLNIMKSQETTVFIWLTALGAY